MSTGITVSGIEEKNALGLAKYIYKDLLPCSAFKIMHSKLKPEANFI